MEAGWGLSASMGMRALKLPYRTSYLGLTTRSPSPNQENAPSPQEGLGGIGEGSVEKMGQCPS